MIKLVFEPLPAKILLFDLENEIREFSMERISEEIIPELERQEEELTFANLLHNEVDWEDV